MYTKLFSKILDSSVWLEPTNTRMIWITLLAAMDQDGFAQFSAVRNLALRARVPLPATEAAVLALESPDPDSNDPENEGRRIERVQGGWMILNAEKYRNLATREMRREQVRKAVKTFREKNKKENTKATDIHIHRVSERNQDVITPLITVEADELMQRIRDIGSWRNPKASAAEHALVIQLAEGADPTELFKALCRIHTWTKQGKYVKNLAEAITRWNEPAELWVYEEKRNGKSRSEQVADEARVKLDAALKYASEDANGTPESDG